MFISKKEFSSSEQPKNFDDMQKRGDYALAQLNLIYQCVKNFRRLHKALEDVKHIKEEKQKRRDNNEIV